MAGIATGIARNSALLGESIKMIWHVNVKQTIKYMASLNSPIVLLSGFFFSFLISNCLLNLLT